MEKLKEFGKSLMYGRNDYSPKVKRIIDDFGSVPIINIKIMRTPISKILRFLMNIISLGEFEKKLKETPYDDLFHLSVIIRTNKGNVSLEKNEVINMDRKPRIPKDAEVLDVTTPNGLTLNTLLEKTKAQMGEKYYKYQAKSNNCQFFILSLLQANNLANTENTEFVKQDTNELFSSYLRKTTNTFTDIAGRLNVLAQGGSIKKKSQHIQMNKKQKEEMAKKLAQTIVGSGFFDDVGNWFKGAADDVSSYTKKAVKDVKKTFTKKKGNELASAALPAVGGVFGSVGGPVGSVAGIVAGDQIAKAATGKGIRKGRFVKGSQEAKDFMAMLREKRNKK